MKKLGSLILIILLIYSLVACNYNDANVMEKFEPPEKSELQVRRNVTPLQSYGNQANQLWQSNALFKDKDWIYAVKYERIIKFHLDDPKTETLIHDFGNEQCYPGDISKLGDWIYFTLEEVAGDDSSLTNLYKIKIDGSGMTKLTNDVEAFILTKNEIYYESYKDWKPDKDGKPVDEMPESDIYVMSLDGRQERRLPGAQSLMGIDNGWIYYLLNLGDLYRMRPDGTGAKNVFDLFGIDGEEISDYILEKDQIIFTRFDAENEEKIYLVMKTIHGKETILDTGVSFDSLNRAGEWLYYSDQNKVYKIKIDGERQKQLVYQFTGKGADGDAIFVDSILLYNDGILLNASYDAVYIKEDGSVMDLGQILEY